MMAQPLAGTRKCMHFKKELEMHTKTFINNDCDK